jgi:hypothetical protein
MDIEALRVRERELWAKVHEAIAVKDAATAEWQPVYRAIKDAELKEAVRAEVLADLAAQSTPLPAGIVTNEPMPF